MSYFIKISIDYVGEYNAIKYAREYNTINYAREYNVIDYVGEYKAINYVCRKVIDKQRYENRHTNNVYKDIICQKYIMYILADKYMINMIK